MQHGILPDLSVCRGISQVVPRECAGESLRAALAAAAGSYAATVGPGGVFGPSNRSVDGPRFTDDVSAGKE